MAKKYFAIVLLFLPMLLSSCVKYESVEIISVKDVTYREFKDNVLRLDITATINNPNMFKVKVKDAAMVLKFKDDEIGSVTQVEQIEIDSRAQKDYKIQAAVKMKDLTSGLLAGYRLLMNESKHLNLSGTMHVKSFLYSKTLQIDKLPLRQ